MHSPIEPGSPTLSTPSSGSATPDELSARENQTNILDMVSSSLTSTSNSTSPNNSTAPSGLGSGGHVHVHAHAHSSSSSKRRLPGGSSFGAASSMRDAKTRRREPGEASGGSGGGGRRGDGRGDTRASAHGNVRDGGRAERDDRGGRDDRGWEGKDKKEREREKDELLDVGLVEFLRREIGDPFMDLSFN